jgi:hypothetical protein
MHGVPMTCCEYQPAAWACAYIAIAMFTVLWLLMLMGQVRLFTVRYDNRRVAVYCCVRAI